MARRTSSGSPAQSTELLAVDRVNELHNTRAAAEAGVAPAGGRTRSRERDAFVLEWLDGDDDVE